MDKPLLFMHMGFPKTGTTTLQEFLCQNRVELLQKGICYPKPIPSVLITDLPEHGHGFASQTGNINFRDVRKHYLQEMKKARVATNILSSENFVFDHSDTLAGYLEYFDVIGIYYFRNLFDYLASLQKTFIRNCFRPDVFTFAEYRNIRILASLRHHMRVLGRDSCVFRDFDKIKNNLLDDFLGIIGIDDKTSFKEVNDLNVTPGDVVHAFLYQASFLPFHHSLLQQLKKELYSMDLRQFGGYKFNALPAAVFELDDYARQAIRFQGELLQDPDWYDKTIAHGEKLRKISYENLNADIQHYIFERLSHEIQNFLEQRLPTDKPEFLPDMKNIETWKHQILPLYVAHCNRVREQLTHKKNGFFPF